MDMMTSDDKVLFIKNTRSVRIVLVLILVLLGFGIRMVDLNDPPLDFAATRQLHSLVLARGYFYSLDVPYARALSESQREFAFAVADNELMDEPPALEWITAFLYVLAGREGFEIPRILISFLWVMGGIPLFLLTRKFTTTNGAVFAVAFYEFLPFGVVASRSFQPDPMMVTFTLYALYFQYCWMENHSTKNALLAAIFTSLAVLAKVPAVFFAGIPFIAIVMIDGIKKAIKNPQVYWMAAIALLPAVIYYGVDATIGGNSSELFVARFFPALYIQPKWYQSWFMMAKSVVDYIPLFLAVLAFFLFSSSKLRIVYAAMWIGYLMQGFVLAYHTASHNYYHLPLIPIVAIGCGHIFSMLFEKIQVAKPTRLSQVFIFSVLLFAAALAVLKSRSDLLAASYRHEESYWKKLGETIGSDNSVLALTHDYGLRLSYWGGILPKLWKTQGDLTVDSLRNAPKTPFATYFKEASEGRDYFLVTLINDFKSQKTLFEFLTKNYPFTQGEGYYLFDLRNPLVSS